MTRITPSISVTAIEKARMIATRAFYDLLDMIFYLVGFITRFDLMSSARQMIESGPALSV
ncbi:MAG: hypothetical protein COB66_05245 [Coxiella sp. (in: Bacteria)]|nr:MAG: hypothetical protein COB66_05245 [Coxiella sp. (in: g-proteobacteria)]